jgi:hypothetical protein
VESRLLLSLHRLTAEIHRFRTLDRRATVFEGLARQMAFDFYGRMGIFFAHRVLLEKEPLEPIAFPDGDYAEFLANLRTLFPDIRFLFLVRDPVPTLWSMTQRKWGFTVMGMEPHRLSLDEHIHTWCSCAELILSYSTDPGSFICHTERLVAHPEEESERILSFLDIHGDSPFQPHPTKSVAFGEAELEKIRGATSRYQMALEKLEGF